MAIMMLELITPKVIIAGSHSGVRKTTIQVCLISSLKIRGLEDQVFKISPDYLGLSIIKPFLADRLESLMLGLNIDTALTQIHFAYQPRLVKNFLRACKDYCRS